MTTYRTPVFDFTVQDDNALNSATKILFSRYRNYCDYEDIKSEVTLWLAVNYHRALEWREKYQTHHAERTLVAALRNAGERYCREEKAERIGYKTEDEFFYSIGMVADLVQLYFDPEWMIPNGIELSKPPSRKPPQEGGDLVAMVADVGRAYEALPLPDKALLKRVYGGERVVADAIACEALDWGITAKAAGDRIRRTVGRLRAKLGGPSPYRTEEE